MMRKCSQFGQKLGRVHCQVVAITKPEIAMGEKANDCRSFVSTHHYTEKKSFPQKAKEIYFLYMISRLLWLVFSFVYHIPWKCN
jgi:hypothetical protein